MDDELSYWLAAVHLPSLEPRKFLKWLTHFSNLPTLFNATKKEWLEAAIDEKYIPFLSNPEWKAVEKDLQWRARPHHHILHFNDADYPPLLKEIANPPLVLYVRGDKKVLSYKQLAMVGSRNATPAGLHNAEHFAYSLAQAGFAITSGLARGIDGASHRGALAAEGVTIGVAGTGLNYIYPASHRSLIEEIVDKKGAVISEFPLLSPPRAHHFPRRNRIIGGLSLGVIVVEAALKSGSLITARCALEEGRDIFAIPGSIHQPLAKGCHALLRQGAKLVEAASDVIEEYNVFRGKAIASPHQTEALSSDCQELLRHIGYEITPIDMIILRSGLTAAQVSSILLRLELHEHIQSVPGGYVRQSLTK